MKIGKALLAGLLLPVVIGALALYLPARQADAFLEQGANRINSEGPLRVTPEDLSRGWTHSSLTTRVALPPPAPSPDRASPPADEPQLVLVHRIGHVPRVSDEGIGYPMETRLATDDPRQPAWLRDSGLASAFTAHTLLRLDGSSLTRIEIHAAERGLPDGGSLSWSGLHGELALDADFTRMRGNGDLGSLELRFADGGLALAATRFRFDLQQAPSGLWFGEQEFTGGPLVVRSRDNAGNAHALHIGTLDLSADSESRPSGLAASLDLTATDTRVDDFTLSRLSLTAAMADIPPAPLLELRDLGRRLQADPGASATGTQRVNALVLEQLLAILQGRPRLQVRPLLLETDLGHFRLDANLGITGNPDDAAFNPLALLQSLDVRVDVAASPALLRAMLIRQNHARIEEQHIASGQEPPAAAELRTAAGAAAEQQLAGWQQLGFLEQAGEELRSRIELRQGALRVNGVPMGPVQAPGMP